MRWSIGLLGVVGLIFQVGCSTAPVADFLDHVRPAQHRDPGNSPRAELEKRESVRIPSTPALPHDLSRPAFDPLLPAPLETNPPQRDPTPSLTKNPPVPARPVPPPVILGPPVAADRTIPLDQTTASDPSSPEVAPKVLRFSKPATATEPK